MHNWSICLHDSHSSWPGVHLTQSIPSSYLKTDLLPRPGSGIQTTPCNWMPQTWVTLYRSFPHVWYVSPPHQTVLTKIHHYPPWNEVLFWWCDWHCWLLMQKKDNHFWHKWLLQLIFLTNCCIYSLCCYCLTPALQVVSPAFVYSLHYDSFYTLHA